MAFIEFDDSLSIIDDSVVLESVGTGETQEIEFKEVTLDIDFGKEIDDAEVIQCVLLKRYPKIINSLIFSNIKSYIYKYVSKYIVSFMNAPKIKQGVLYFGISDNRVVTGITFVGEFMSVETIRNMIVTSCAQIRVIDEETSTIKLVKKDKLTELFDVKIHNVTGSVKDKKDEVTTTIHNILTTFNNDMNAYTKARELRDKWYTQFKVFDRKILDIGNDLSLRTDIISFIFEHLGKSWECRRKAIDWLSTNKLFTYAHEDIRILKLDDTNPIFWITEYKDNRRAISLLKRPPAPNRPSRARRDKAIIQLFSLLSPMIHCWASAGVSYYVIEIDIHAHGLKDSEYAEYTFGKAEHERWIYKRRGEMGSNGPSCLDY